MADDDCATEVADTASAETSVNGAVTEQPDRNGEDGQQIDSTSRAMPHQTEFRTD